MREDWTECTFEEIVNSFKRGPFGGDLKKSFFVEKGYCVYEQQHAINNDFTTIRYFINDERFKKLEACVVGAGDYIVSCSGTMGKIARLPQNAPKGIINQALLRISLNDKIMEHNYFVHYFRSKLFQAQILKDSRGSGMQNLAGMKEIKIVPISLAPLPVQRAIVSKIEALFSDLDNGIANFKKAQEQLKIYRQAVLKKAFEGELTKEWREKRALSGVEVPTAEELLKQIKEERQNHYNQQIEDWKKAVKEWEKNGKKGKRPSRVSKPKEVSEVKESDIENYETLPSRWKWSRFGNVTYKIGDIDHKMPKTVENGYPYLSTGNLNSDGTIDFSGAKTISKEDFDRLALKIKPQKGDIIFPRYGTIGRNILIDFDREFLVSYSCAIIKNITSLMSSKFALYYSLSPVIKKEIKRYTVETTQANIGIASIENFVFPLCSTQEQNQIVQEIESRLSVCDKVEQSISESIVKAEALRQSILKKAFEGKLLSEAEIEQCKQAADYEPASELLKKIKAEKLAKEQEKKKTTTKKKSKK
ncbi:MAG: restriction endonuclease subunit S [Bacteroidales bacterium]|nr:restriction endonuclease subunit S [Bacteroidales bacterium]